MKRILTLLLLLISFAATSQIYQKIPGYGFRWDRVMPDSVLHVPKSTDTAFRTNSRLPQLRIVGDSLWLYDGAKWKRAGASGGQTVTTLPWDSITGKPVNFSTTYALSNDIADSIQARVIVKDNADYRIVTGTANVKELKAQSRLNFYPDSGLMIVSAAPGSGFGANIDFDNQVTNGSYWGIYGGSPGYPGLALYRFLPSQIELAYWDSDRYALRNDVKMAWSSTNLSFNTPDVAISREGASLLQINNGTTNSYADLKLRTLTSTDLAGTGTRMVVANASGVLSTQAIPTSSVVSVFGRSGTVTAQSGDYTTAQVTESGNLYFTNTRAITALTTNPITGALNFDATSGRGVFWGLNTDGAFIRFISTGNGAGQSYLEIGTSDDNDEPIIFTQTGVTRVQIATDGLLKNGANQNYVFENSGTWAINIGGNSATTSQTNFSALSVGGTQVVTNNGGTWNIAILGNAGSANNANALNGVSVSNLNTDRSTGKLEYFDQSGGIGAPSAAWHSYISTRHNNNSNQYGFQLANEFGSNNLLFRGWDGANPLSWLTLLSSANFNSYAPTLTGTGASGTWNISVSGNAATASNSTQWGGYTNNIGGGPYAGAPDHIAGFSGTVLQRYNSTAISSFLGLGSYAYRSSGLAELSGAAFTNSISVVGTVSVTGAAAYRSLNAANTSGFDIGLLGGTTDANAYIYQRANAAIYFATNNTTRLTLAADGSATFTGAVQMNSTLRTEGATDLVASSGTLRVGHVGTTTANTIIDARGRYQDGEVVITATAYGSSGSAAINGTSYSVLPTGGNAIGVSGYSIGPRSVGTNIGGYFTASGAPTNWGIYVDGNSYFSANTTVGSLSTNTINMVSATALTFNNAAGTPLATLSHSSGLLALNYGLSVSGAASVNGQLSIGTNNSGSNYVYFAYQGHPNSRSIRLAPEQIVYGDFAIQRSTTQTGSTYQNLLYWDGTGVASFLSSVVANGELTSITTSGGVYIRNSSDIVDLHIRPNNDKGGYITFTENADADRWAIGVSANDAKFHFRVPYSSSTSVFNISNAGAGVFASSVTATSFFESSDIRLKEVFIEQDSKDEMNAIFYRFKGKEQLRWGYSAQAVQKVLPYAVQEDNKGFLSVDYTTVHTYKIAQLEARIALLENQLRK